MNFKIQIIMKQLLIFASLLFLVAAQTGDAMDSGECKMGHGDGMFMAKKFMDGFMKCCLNVTFPEEMQQISKECMRKTMMNTTIIKDVTQGIFPDKPTLAQFLRNLVMCKYRDSGITSPETNMDAESLIRAVKLDQWTGDQQEINMVRSKIRECVNTSQGATNMDKLMNHNKCMVENLINYCTSQNKDPGMMLVIASKLLTINDDSKCARVKVPQDALDTRKQCMEEAKRNMTTMPSEIEKMKNPMKKMKMIAKYFMKDYLMKSMECCGEKKGFYNRQTKVVNARGIADYIKSFEGWNDIPQERDMVYNAVVECGKAFDGISMDGPDTSSSEEDMDDMKMKEMMKDKIEFEKCFSPKFAKTCGINNQLADFLYPLLDPQFMGDVFKAFMDIGGKEAVNIIEGFKQKM